MFYLKCNRSNSSKNMKDKKKCFNESCTVWKDVNID